MEGNGSLKTNRQPVGRGQGKNSVLPTGIAALRREMANPSPSKTRSRKKYRNSPPWGSQKTNTQEVKLMAAPRKILICEDEDAIREFEVINLQRSGYDGPLMSAAARCHPCL